MTVMHRGVVDGDLHPGFVDECVECTADPESPFFDEKSELGSPGPWWHRAWCRFVAWYLTGRVEAAMRRHPAGKKKEK